MGRKAIWKGMVCVTIAAVFLVPTFANTTITHEKLVSRHTAISSGKEPVYLTDIKNDCSGPKGTLGEYIDQEQTEDDRYGWNIYRDQWVAQSFKPSVSRISRIELKMFKWNGNPNFELVFKLRENLYGDDLIIMNKNSYDFRSYPGGWVNFNLGNITVEVNKTYYIICGAYKGSHSTPYYCWFYKQHNPYPRGACYIYHTDWNIERTYNSDCAFKTYYTSEPPVIPSPPSGPTFAKPGKEYTYSTVTTDPDGDKVRYCFDWGDNTTTWTDWINSGEVCHANHTWVEKSIYNVNVKARDDFKQESNWSESTFIVVPKTYTSPFPMLIEKIFECLEQTFGRSVFLEIFNL